MKKFKDKSILVTGSCGTVGSELVKQLLGNDVYSPTEVIGIDNNENALFFQDQEHLNDSRAHFYAVDVRDRDALTYITKNIDIIFHCAAMKHVILSERSPDQCIRTNINGVDNVIYAANTNSVETVIFTSSDKAVNPTNVMGTSKLMGERLMTAANSHKKSKGPIFSSTRFGNVLGSNGSVIPIFHNQIAKGGPVTLTHRDMTRFVMSIQESVRLVIDSALLAKGGEVFITKMPVIRIEDLAKVMISCLAPKYGMSPDEIKIIEIGTKPGEKLYEELMSDEETRRSLELDKYFSVTPAFKGIYSDISYTYESCIDKEVTNPYVSSDVQSLSLTELSELLTRYELLETPKEEPVSRYWPGDKETAK